LPEYKDRAHDLTLKYGNTYTYYTDGNFPRQLVLWLNFSDDTDLRVASQFMYPGGESARFVDPSGIEEIHPEVGFVNIPLENQNKLDFPTFAWNLVRLPRRSPSRGFSHQTYHIASTIETFIVPYTQRYNLVFSLDVIPVLENRHYVAFPDIFGATQLGRSAALSRHFAVTLNPFERDGPLILNSQFGHVGHVYPDHIDVYHKGSYQEISDFVNRDPTLRGNIEVCLNTSS
jgi:hypothetical protein